MVGVADTASGVARRREDAPAKLNLFLHVGARMADGYHALESLVVFLELGDRLRLEPAQGFELVRTGPYAAALPDRPDEDLTARAITGLAEICGHRPDFTVTLEKHIPVAAGLGGGSADAAAAIRLLCREWDVDPNDKPVRDFAQALGADVPMCLQSRPAWIRGLGEQITPVEDCAELHLLLVNPRVPLSTAQVFGAYAPGETKSADLSHADLATTASVLAFLAHQRNDLAGPAQALCPVVSDVQQELARSLDCGLVRMSGSGPTCFAIFDDRETCDLAGSELGTRHPDWWVSPTRTTHKNL